MLEHYDLSDFLNFVWDEDVVEQCEVCLEPLKRLADMLEERLISAARDEAWAAVMHCAGAFGIVEKLIVDFETSLSRDANIREDVT